MRGERLAAADVLCLAYLGAGNQGGDPRSRPTRQRRGTARLASVPPRFVEAAVPLLSDPVRAVRIEAARALAGTDLLSLTPEQQTALVKATAELVADEMVDADRPEAHLNLV